MHNTAVSHFVWWFEYITPALCFFYEESNFLKDEPGSQSVKHIRNLDHMPCIIEEQEARTKPDV